MTSTLLVFNDIRVSGGRPISDLPIDESVRAIDAFATLLRYGRDRDWQIAHVLRESRACCGPARGIEPLSSEPVFLLREHQALNLERLQAAAACGVRVLILASFVLNEAAWAILQTGLDLGLSVTLLADGAASIDPRVGDLVRRGVRIVHASQLIAGEHNQVLWLSDYLEGNRGHGGDNGV